jgi:hypothetical protein
VFPTLLSSPRGRRETEFQDMPQFLVSARVIDGRGECGGLAV